MSHLHEREEKVCLNCGAALIGRYCQDCGQENVEPKESTWHLIVHFFNDVTHFDGKFFTTMKPLLFKPGLLTEEYVKGRRASYLNPIRMYLFISALFFLVLMSVMTIPHKTDTKSVQQAVKLTHADTVINLQSERDRNKLFDNMLDKDGPQTVAQYDSQQKALPKAERDNFINRYYSRRTYAAIEYGRKHQDTVWRDFMSIFFHSLPKVFFISLPLFAALLMLLYTRRRKQYYYVSHTIFTVHIYCFSFILWLVVIVTGSIPVLGSLIAFFTPFIIFFYLYKAMRKFYKQGRGKTILKFTLMYFGIGFLVVALTIGLILNSFMNIAAPH